MSKRHKTATELGLESRGKKERDAVPKVFEDEATGVHNRVRALAQAHRELDGKVESIASDVADLRESSARSEGKLDILVEQHKVTNEQKIAEIHDEVDKRKARRALWLKGAGLVTGGGIVSHILHWLGLL